VREERRWCEGRGPEEDKLMKMRKPGKVSERREERCEGRGPEEDKCMKIRK